MITYRVPRLSDDTSKSDKQHLIDELQSLGDVESAHLQPEMGTFTVNGKGKVTPHREAVYSAARKAGFPVTLPYDHPMQGI